MPKITNEWSTLDNAAKIFPPSLRKSYSTFFRLEVVLKAPVILDVLHTAATSTLKRYPHLQVRVKRGFFWYFFEQYEHEVHIYPLNDYELCHYSKVIGKKQAPLWRILVHENRLAIEFSHIITDGMGGLEFIKTLLCVYYELLGGIITDWQTVKRLDDAYDAGEFEYSYKKYFNKFSTKQQSIPSSFHFPDMQSTVYKGRRIQMPVHQIKQCAKQYNVSITAYITALYFFTAQKLYQKMLKGKKSIVRYIVLINLRQFFPSKTLRNFFWMIMPKIDFSLGAYDFDEIVKKVHFQMQDMLDTREIQRHFSSCVAPELVLINRLIPRTLKDRVLLIAQKFQGERINTSSVSNVGRLELPVEVLATVQSMAVFPIPSMITGKNLGIISVDDTLTIATGGFIDNIQIEQALTLELKKQNIDVTFLEW